ncbi:EAL domain-containing protein [Natroniella sulfidigena]|uniref:putative bifunctional diguanylate cyclase/phosphodiesterase n=1 Tax=Natroniella sulfidigena TaxID=723921 RepID=UPI00200ADA71|nr:EAL domain-containing protein [Natroniella sulfidigena]MCK8816841.1 EAL domain-containing protein [Natroniella sulfidigena]
MIIGTLTIITITLIILQLKCKKKKQKLIAKEKFNNKIINATNSLIIVFNQDYKITSFNSYSTELTGYKEAEVIGENFLNLLQDNNTKKELQNNLPQLLADNKSQQPSITTQINCKEGTECNNDKCLISWTFSEIESLNQEGDSFLAIGKNITELHKVKENLKYQNYHDHLTGLPNRKYFNDQFKKEVEYATDNNYKFAVMLLDIDRFKLINSIHGHQTGDQLLKKIGKQLKDILKPRDQIARMSGDEFMGLLTQIRKPKKEIEIIVNQILELFERPFEINDKEFNLTVSIGIAFYPSDGKSAEELLKHADIAVYRAKEIRGNNFELYDIDMNHKVNEKLFIERDLRKAIDNHQLEVYYQPIVDFKTGKITKAEALVRWNHPQRGLISPGKFIPLAEETGLIVPLGNYVLKSACQQIKHWAEAGYNPIKVSVNLSAQQLHKPGLEENISKILANTNLRPDLLGIEITESIAMQNIPLTSSILERFKEMGISVLLDDFGTGYSSLSYLNKFPIDILKIDRSFIKGISIEDEKSAIVSAIIAMANKLQIKTVAEGIETIKQFNLAKEYNCDEAQGYLFSKPIPAAEFEKLLQKEQNFNQLNIKTN